MGPVPVMTDLPLQSFLVSSSQPKCHRSTSMVQYRINTQIDFNLQSNTLQCLTSTGPPSVWVSGDSAMDALMHSKMDGLLELEIQA